MGKLCLTFLSRPTISTCKDTVELSVQLSVELWPRVRGKKYEKNSESFQAVRRLDEFLQQVLQATCHLSGLQNYTSPSNELTTDSRDRDKLENKSDSLS